MPIPGDPVTDEERAEIRRMHGEGMSCRKIGEAIGRPAATVSVVAKDMGLSFDRAQTRAATEARQADNAARRAAIVQRLYARAEQNLTRLEADTFQTLGQTQYGVQAEEFEFVPTGDELNLSRALSTYLKSAGELEKVDAGSGSSSLISSIGEIGEALAAVARSFESGDSDGA